MDNHIGKKRHLCLIMFIILSSVVHCSLLLANGAVDQQPADHKIYKRIISLYSAHTENLCSLGAESQLVGISRSDDYPEHILSKPRLSYREDPEKFIALRPDLVLIRPMIARSYPEFVKKLRNANIEVISLQPNNITEMLEYWRTLGQLTGRQDQATLLIQNFNQALSQFRKAVANIPLQDRPKVYFQSIHKKMKTFAPESIGIFVLLEAGGINVGNDAIQMRKTNIAYYGKERLLSHGSEIDIFLAQRGRMNPIEVSTILQEPGFKAIKAVRNNKVHLIEEALVSRPTVRILTGIKQLFTLFYPNHNVSPQTSQ